MQRELHNTKGFHCDDGTDIVINAGRNDRGYYFYYINLQDYNDIYVKSSGIQNEINMYKSIEIPTFLNM